MREVRLNNMLGLAMPKELIESKPDVLYDLSEQDGARYRGHDGKAL